jgi:coproporphyrinogen III oxidase
VPLIGVVHSISWTSTTLGLGLGRIYKAISGVSLCFPQVLLPIPYRQPPLLGVGIEESKNGGKSHILFLTKKSPKKTQYYHYAQDYEDTRIRMRDRMTAFVESLQQRLIAAFDELDPTYKFQLDSWTRDQGGYGMSGVISDSRLADPSLKASGAVLPPSILEKGGINTSIVQGILPPAAIAQMRAHHGSIPSYDPTSKTSLPYFAAGISIVLHPRNPYAPTIHANYRYFEITEEEKTDEKDEKKEESKPLAWWFGGGSDLTPSYLFEEDAVHFHKTLKGACDKHGTLLHPSLKKWCDEYFYLPHRSESRGIGGIFFDDLSEEVHARMPNSTRQNPQEKQTDERPWGQEEIFRFLRSCAESFLPSYLPILKKRMDMEYGEHQRRWQLLRRGRYVEFNLVIDR